MIKILLALIATISFGAFAQTPESGQTAIIPGTLPISAIQAQADNSMLCFDSSGLPSNCTALPPGFSASIQPPTPSTLGGVFSKTATSHQFLNQVGTDGTVTAAQVAMPDLSGAMLPSQLAAGSTIPTSNTSYQGDGSWVGPPPLLLSSTLVNQGNGPYWMFTRTSDATLFSILPNDCSVKSYSLTNPATPVFEGIVAVGTAGCGTAYLAMYGNYLFVTDQNTSILYVVDATNPAVMVVIGTVAFNTNGGGGSRIDISPNGHYAFIGGPETGTQAQQAIVVDISTVTAPVVVGRTVAIGSSSRGVQFLSNTIVAFSSRDDNTVEFIDISTPSAPVLASSYHISTTLGTITTPMLYDSASSTLYVGNFSGYVIALNVSNIMSVSVRSAVAVPTGPEQMAFSGTGYIAVGCRISGNTALLSVSNLNAITDYYNYQHLDIITPGVAYFSGYVYTSVAHVTTNGIIDTLGVNQNLQAAFLTIQASIASLGSISASLGANTFFATQKITSPVALNLSNDNAQIILGTTSPDTITRNAAGQLTYNGLIIANGGLETISSGALLRAKNNVSNAQFTYQQGTDGGALYGDGTNAADVRTGRTAAGIFALITGKINAQGGAGLGLASNSVAPTSKLEVGASTSTAGTGSVKIDTGTLTTVAEAGDLSNDGRLTFTDTTVSRARISNVLFEQTGTQSIANTSTATTLFGSGAAAGGGLTLTNNYFSAGRTLRVTLSGVYSAQATPGNATVTVLLGGTTIATATISNLPVAGISGALWETSFYIVCRTAGASGTVMTSGRLNYDLGSGSAGFVALNNGGTTTTISTPSSLALDVRWSWATASSSNTISSIVATVEGI